jgi:hypothetical protein
VALAVTLTRIAPIFPSDRSCRWRRRAPLLSILTLACSVAVFWRAAILRSGTGQRRCKLFRQRRDAVESRESRLTVMLPPGGDCVWIRPVARSSYRPDHRSTAVDRARRIELETRAMLRASKPAILARPMSHGHAILPGRSSPRPTVRTSLKPITAVDIELGRAKLRLQPGRRSPAGHE